MEELDDQDGTVEPKGEESAPFRDMVKQRDAAMAKLAIMEAKEADALVEAQQLRENAAGEIVNALGVPKLKEDVLNWVEGELTEQSVRAALEAKGLNLVGTPDEAPQEPEAPSSDSNESTSKLGQSVADAAQGGAVKELGSRIVEAENADALIAMMDEAGASVGYI
jgi:hypothetical protein